MHDNDDITDLAELNLLHDILHPYKHIKGTNYHYSLILNICINKRRVK